MKVTFTVTTSEEQPHLIGRDLGEAWRKLLNLDRLEDIPNTIFLFDFQAWSSPNSSFLMGLLERSYRKSHSVEEFNRRYQTIKSHRTFQYAMDRFRIRYPEIGLKTK